MKALLRKPEIWVLALLFSVGTAGTIGVFSLLPTFLSVERALDYNLVNTLLGLSRISAAAAIFVAGYLIDRVGLKPVMVVLLLGAGLTTFLLGVVPGMGVFAVVFLQPPLVHCSFPAYFAAVSRITSNTERNLAVSMVIPISFSVGAGLVPAVFGLMADRGLFAACFMILGAVLAASTLILPRLSFHRPA